MLVNQLIFLARGWCVLLRIWTQSANFRCPSLW